jgi:hypothetical protein
MSTQIIHSANLGLTGIALLSKATEQIHANPEVAFNFLHDQFEKDGPFHVAKKYDCLVNNSGEELAMVIMTFRNIDHPNYY